MAIGAVTHGDRSQRTRTYGGPGEQEPDRRLVSLFLNTDPLAVIGLGRNRGSDLVFHARADRSGPTNLDLPGVADKASAGRTAGVEPNEQLFGAIREVPHPKLMPA